MDSEFYGPKYSKLVEDYKVANAKYDLLTKQIEQAADIQKVNRQTTEAQEEVKKANDKLNNDPQVLELQAEYNQLVSKLSETRGEKREEIRRLLADA